MCRVVKTNTQKPRKDVPVLNGGRVLEVNSIFLLPGIFVCAERHARQADICFSYEARMFYKGLKRDC